MFHRLTVLASCVAALFLAAATLPLCGAELLPPGFRPLPVGVHALAGGKLVVRPGEVLEGGTLIIREGLIETVGQAVAPPPDARVWDMKGTTIYAGFIDTHLSLGGTNAPVSADAPEPERATGLTASGMKFFGTQSVQTEKGQPGPGASIPSVTPEYRVVKDYSPQPKFLAPLRELGFTVGLLCPVKGVVRGTSTLVALSEESPNQAVIREDVFQHVSFDTQRSAERVYPSSLMGAIAVVRQTAFDARHYQNEQTRYKQGHARQRPEANLSLEALAPVLGRKLPVCFEPGSALMVDRAARLARELEFNFCILASGQEWRRPDLLPGIGCTFVVPLAFPELPKMPRDSDWEQVSLDQLRAWDWAPENPALLRNSGRELALTSHGLENRKQFRPNLRLALDRGLSEGDALAALTTIPARLCGVEELMGTLEPGKIANLTVVTGDSYFNPDNKVREVWIDGRLYRNPEEFKEEKDGRDEAKPGATSATAPGRESSTANPKEEPEKRAKPPELAAEEKKPGSPALPEKPAAPEKEKQKNRELRKKRLAHPPLAGRGPLLSPGSVLVKGATLWTCGPDGRLDNADLLVVDGKLKAVGKDLSAPPGLSPLIIDGRGVHVTPGLIDCHSHSAILGAVNESTLPSTAMVRISDVVNSETDNLYEQLAGGVTLIHLLHGSANPIGGQACVIKLRDGASPEDLIFAAAPPGIKFALGENVKQSGWGEKYVTRFPQTRMGVRTFIANRFTAARQYLAEWQTYESRRSTNSSVLAPRRDLELEALGEVLQGRRWIHCHAYRQDELLMLLRLMESFGVKIGTFQHVLEGYKVADEIARHGAGASTFSDWWAYKFEVYDAIAYNGSLMRDRGVLVSFNSDSSELARRLYTEAAKAVKYGGTPEQAALDFVTINPAKQLRLDAYVGSLEPGKDADFALWSKSPLDSATVCLQTWIEGRKYFDHAQNKRRAAQLEAERNALLDHARKLSKPSHEDGDKPASPDSDSFFRVSLEREFEGQSRSCSEGSE